MDVLIEQAVIDGHLPGESEDFFQEKRMQNYFQQVVENEHKNKMRVMGDGTGMYNDVNINHAQDGVGAGDQDDQAPDHN